VETATDRSLGRFYFPTELKEAGLPIGQLTCFQALRRGSGVRQGVGIPKIWLRTIACEINDRPSIFSPRLVSEAERVAKGTPSETNVAMLRAWWEANQIRREILDNFRDQHPTNTWRNGPFWVNSGSVKFLLELNDDVLWPSNTYHPGDWHYNMTPKAVIASGLADRIRKSGVSLPPYALAKFDVVGEKITIPQEPPIPTVSRAMPVLGEADATWEWRILGSSGNSRYPFHIQVLLASPEILYARQSQRTFMFTALIVASALAAMIGLFSAYASFRRQRQLSEMKSDFVSSVSHELRAPIASVRLMAEGLERGKISEPAKQHEYFKFIVQECRRLSSLIENVLDFSRIEEGRKRYEMESTDLVAFTQQTVKVMETYAAERDISLALRVTGTAAPVDLDGKAMQQALVNLINNAIKHSPKGSTITVGLDFHPSPAAADIARDPQPSSVLLSVEDHGEGIAASEQDKIFERFYRIGSELRRETQGVGIGLSIVKHIVEAHGGTVTVRSAPGQGSRFTIQLLAGGRDGPLSRPLS
jgi:signal transduction histidine kinase